MTILTKIKVGRYPER